MDWTSYSFLIVALGTAILGSVAGCVGVFSVERGQSLIGDSLSHASFPGVILAFMLLHTKEPSALLFGAVLIGMLAFLAIRLVERCSTLRSDTGLAVVLASFFGVGMVLKTYIQGNDAYSNPNPAGLSNYLFGQAAYLFSKDIILLTIVSTFSLLFVIIFQKSLTLYIFDPVFAQTMGISTKKMDGILLLMTLFLIAAGLKVVGSILISAMLIAPVLTAKMWTANFIKLQILSALVGALSAVLGTWASTAMTRMPTGPAIVVALSLLFFVSMCIGPYGLRSAKKKEKNYVKAGRECS